MKKIYLLIAAVGALVACDPVSEDISVSGSITAAQLESMSSVTVDKAPSGQNGNVVTCTTSAPVNAKWTIDGKDLLGNSAWKKMKVGEYTVTLTGLNPDGSVVTVNYPIRCDEITNPLERYWIYGQDPAEQAPFKPGAWDAAAMRFSANEGKFVDVNGKEGSLPFLTDEVYWGFKTLIFELGDFDPNNRGRIMNGWWSARYEDGGDAGSPILNAPYWELQLTEAIAKDCAQGGGGGGKDLDIMLTSGSCTVNSIFYEE